MNYNSKIKADNDAHNVFEDSTLLANFEDSFMDISARLLLDNSKHPIENNTLDVSALCCDEEISGYDKLTGKTWIYPTNYPVRDYQFNIIKAALLNNTLVSLPTGLGKTFIAAVVMYNFYRWYPLGKIIFTAPTRPLVAQQISACYNIIAIPPNDTVEMTGHMAVSARAQHWQTKRVFFATPQVIYNDLRAGICPANRIRCLVLDEAHRARGNYAFCQIIDALTDMGLNTYRVLALSATPGSKVDDVVSVVKRLHIAHLELRTDSCADVAPYTHARHINTVVVPLGEQLTRLRQHYVQILDGYARRLKQLNILPHNLGNLSKGRVVMLYKEFQTRERANRHPQHGDIMRDFTLLIALFHGLELLTRHGARVFLSFFDDHPEKSWVQADDTLTALLERLRDDLGDSPASPPADISGGVLPDGTVPMIPQILSFGHPKFIKLKEIMLYHFTKAQKQGRDTRAIVFCEYRESVSLVHRLLLQCRPLILPRTFVGQGHTVSQKQQLRVMRSFVSGVCNVLVATCVAEEGLDVGSVDLIVCFDISTRSPVRLVQRCGRTGRERGGQVHILVTEGREHQTLLECMRQRDGLNKKVMQSREIQRALYTNNPRMLPRGHVPQCQKMYITVNTPNQPGPNDGMGRPKKGSESGDLRSMLVERTSSCVGGSAVGGELISERELSQLFPAGLPTYHMFSRSAEFSFMSADKINETSTSATWSPTPWLEWQRTLQTTVNVRHSRDTEVLSKLLQYCDAKRFQLPANEQNPSFNTQDVVLTQSAPSPQKLTLPPKQKPTKMKQKINVNAKKDERKRDGDIRALFSTTTKSTKCYTNFIKDIGPQVDKLPTALLNLLVDLNLNATNKNERCLICDNVCDCSVIKELRSCKGNSSRNSAIELTFLKDRILPDIDLLDEITLESIQNFVIKNESQIIEIDQNNVNEFSKTKGNNESNNFDLDFDFESPLEEHVETYVNSDENLDSNFIIGDIDDVFAESCPEKNDNVCIVEKECNEDIAIQKESSVPKETLGFFGLDSIDDIFEDSCEIVEKSPEISKNTQIGVSPLLMPPDKSTPKPSTENNQAPVLIIENPASPSILSGKVKTNVELPSSPILCSQTARKFSLSIKKDKMKTSTPQMMAKKKLSYNDVDNCEFAIPNTPLNCKQDQSVNRTGNISMFTITQLVDMINKTDNTHNTTNLPIGIDSVTEDGDRCTSPILFTQADVKRSTSLNNTIGSKISATQSKRNESLIILESDSDSDDNTQIYDLENDKFKDSCCFRSPLSNKRNYGSDENKDLTASPFFPKRQKVDNNNEKPLTLQEKVLEALTRSSGRKPNETTINFLSTQLSAQKENRNPQLPNNHNNFSRKDNEDNTQMILPEPQKGNSIQQTLTVSPKRNYLEMLQMFRRENKSTPLRSKLAVSRTKSDQNFRRKQVNIDSDEDFASEIKNSFRSQTLKHTAVSDKPKANHKVRKKKSNHNSLLDMEAAQSDDGSHSGDEMSDDSVGSIVDFICDDLTQRDDDDDDVVDMQALYMKSVKSPVNGKFKIPYLPKKYANEEVLSQTVEEDAYEMDSFCVDSNIGLTQANDLSELELAEIALEDRRKRKVRTKLPSDEDSPIVRKRRKKVKLQLESDSDDSS